MRKAAFLFLSLLAASAQAAVVPYVVGIRASDGMVVQIDAVDASKPRPQVIQLGGGSASHSIAWSDAVQPDGYLYHTFIAAGPQSKWQKAFVFQSPTSIISTANSNGPTTGPIIGIAWDAGAGHFWAVGDQEDAVEPALYSVSETGVYTLVGDLGLGGADVITGIAVMNGDLYGCGFFDNLYIIDTGLPQAFTVNSLVMNGLPIDGCDGLTHDFDANKLLIEAYDQLTGNAVLGEINTSTGVITPRGPIIANTFYEDIAYLPEPSFAGGLLGGMFLLGFLRKR